MDHLLSGETRVEGGAAGEESDGRANFFRRFDDVVAVDDSSSVRGLEDGGQQAESGRFSGSVCAEQTVYLAWISSKSNVVDGAHFAALFILEPLGQTTGFNH